MVDSAFLLLAFYIFIDCVRMGLLGVLKGLNKEEECFLGCFILLFFLGLPIGCELALNTGLGIKGFFFGSIIGNIFTTIYLIYELEAKIDWTEALLL